MGKLYLVFFRVRLYKLQKKTVYVRERKNHELVKLWIRTKARRNSNCSLTKFTFSLNFIQNVSYLRWCSDLYKKKAPQYNQISKNIAQYYISLRTVSYYTVLIFRLNKD